VADPLPKYARVSPTNPEAWGQCDRCGFTRNVSDLVFQVEWAGQQLFNQQILVCKDRCYDTPQEQLRTIILPPDPPPVINARTINYAYEEYTPMILQFASINSPPWGDGPNLIFCDQTGEVPLALQYLTSS
jgi:hypothetical protein